ncbi:MAG: CoA-binding protein [Treponemataceae bacterium]|nr:CoA-binding protein [Treponemataceae bacterium]
MVNTRTVVVLGASDNPDRYSYRAVQELHKHGFAVIPVNPALSSINGLSVLPRLKDINEKVDTLTIYLSEKRSTPLISEILALRPGRVILNPGAENPTLEKALSEAGIPWLHACTLVLLSTGRF